MRGGAPDGIAEILTEAHERDDVEFAELMSAFNWNDVGVAGVSLAHSAAKAATFYSCSSGLDKSHHAKYPTVGVLPDAQRAAMIADLAKCSDCGVGQQWGRWYLYARSVSALHGLGKAILTCRAAFDALPAPTWAEGLEAELEHISDY
ncbi:N-6 DNA methylase [Streptomyces xiamenensis]|uniref:N-6 DNA methylase n=1 Tax=Streptomyces xiamenensis TaxID=408015 RepID=A0A0F7FVI4_9ACTN|nr:hypothetical protein [Streptomyces xiamenensis]AKG43869.1 N-6 DNA methylase [Streptomyces xiamenensis]